MAPCSPHSRLTGRRSSGLANAHGAFSKPGKPTRICMRPTNSTAGSSGMTLRRIRNTPTRPTGTSLSRLIDDTPPFDDEPRTEVDKLDAQEIPWLLIPAEELPGPGNLRTECDQLVMSLRRDTDNTVELRWICYMKLTDVEGCTRSTSAPRTSTAGWSSLNKETTMPNKHPIVDPDAAVAALNGLVDTINATGGVSPYHEDRPLQANTPAPVADEDWIDLGMAYALACRVLGLCMQWTGAEEGTHSAEQTEEQPKDFTARSLLLLSRGVGGEGSRTGSRSRRP